MATGTPVGSTISLTATGAATAAVTLTIPAPAAATFQYVTWIEITHFRAAVLTAAAVPVVVTTTNLNGNPSFDFPADAGLQGAITRVQVAPDIPIKGSVAATAITIVCPATTSVIWRVSALWFVGP